MFVNHVQVLILCNANIISTVHTTNRFPEDLAWRSEVEWTTCRIHITSLTQKGHKLQFISRNQKMYVNIHIASILQQNCIKFYDSV